MADGAGARTACAGLLGLALSGASSYALGCSLPPEGWTGVVEDAVPANGVIAVSLRCYGTTGCNEAPDPQAFQLLDAAGKSVAGTAVVPTLTGVGGLWTFTFAFKPSAELVEGEYSATMGGALATQKFTKKLTVTPAIAWSEAPVVREEPYPIDRAVGEPICCADQSVGSCRDQTCYHEQVLRSTGLNLSWTSEQAGEKGQYAYRVATHGVPASEWTSGDEVQLPESVEATDSVCYALELLRLTDGVVRSYEERCVERPVGLGPIGVFATDPQSITQTLRSCSSPPAGKQAEWCSANTNRCDPDDGSEECEKGFAALCSDGSVAGADGGCACSVGRVRSTSASLGWLAFGVALLVARQWSRRRDALAG